MCIETISFQIDSIRYRFINGHALAYGTIYVKINDKTFPCNTWDDIVSSVLDMWLHNIIDFILEKHQRLDLYFMDGPYLISVDTAPSHSNGLVYLIERYVSTVKYSISNVDMLIHSILDCAKSFLIYCHDAPEYFKDSDCIMKIKREIEVLDSLVKWHGD